MSGNQAFRGSPHGQIEKEMCHLKAEKNKLNHSGCLLRLQILLHCFVCLCTCIFFLFYYPTLSLYVCSNPIMIIFSVDGHNLAFLYDRIIIIVIICIIMCLLQSETRQH